MNKWSITVHFANGSAAIELLESCTEARRYARDNVSYSGGRVIKVSLTGPYESHAETLWQRDWDDVSKAAGLSIPR